jgi:hypothetical protein
MVMRILERYEGPIRVECGFVDDDEDRAAVERDDLDQIERRANQARQEAAEAFHASVRVHSFGWGTK